MPSSPGRGGLASPSRLFMLPRDIALFRRSARTDAAIARVRARDGGRAAFERVYAGGADPWASADPRYRYQRNKYLGLMAMLPAGRRYRRALDLGCGGGVFTTMLTGVADSVLGLDIAQEAIEGARSAVRDNAGGQGALRFERGDITALPAGLEGGFDLVVVADTIYYIDDTSPAALARVAASAAALVAPGGHCLIANHYFFAADRSSRLSRRIHDSFVALEQMDVASERRRAFYLATLLAKPAPVV